MKTAWGLLNVVQLLLMALWTMGWISLALLLRVVTFNPDFPLLLARRAWAPGVLWLAGARLRVEPLPELPAPCIFVMNHQSTLDICCAFAALPCNLRFVAKHTLARVPFLGWFMRATGMVFINRESRFQAVQALRRAGEAIRSGKSILMYPEGTRARGDFSVQPFKRGPFALAVEARVPVVPVGVVGAEEQAPALANLRPVARALGFPAFPVTPTLLPVPLPSRYHILFGEPLRFNGRPDDDDGVLERKVQQVKAAIRGLLERGLAERTSVYL